MRSLRVSVLVGSVLLVTAACATRDEWVTWHQHPAHFASGDHLSFSVRNTEGSSPRVTRTDVALARDEAWWGKPITVGQEQILER